MTDPRVPGGGDAAGVQDPTEAMLDGLWALVLARWEDEATHQMVLEHSVRVQRLPDLAGRYRALVDDPQRGPTARKRLDAITAAATAMLWSMQTPKPQKIPLSIALSAFGVSAFLLLLLAWAMWGRRAGP